jgi:serine protease AprX
MSAPVVSGAAVLMIQANTNLTPDTIKARMMLSADKWADATGNYDPCTYGAGYLNIPAAINCTAIATQYAMSPILFQDTNGNVNVSLDASFYGTRAIWGTGLTDLRAIWGTNAIWGTTTLSSSRAIWGTTVWGDRALWGTTSAGVDLSATGLYGEQ